MPVYCYRCIECEAEFEVRHSMSFDSQECLQCGASNVFRIPSIGTSPVASASPGRPGKIVDEYINDVKKEIKQEKKRLRSETL